MLANLIFLFMFHSFIYNQHPSHGGKHPLTEETPTAMKKGRWQGHCATFFEDGWRFVGKRLHIENCKV